MEALWTVDQLAEYLNVSKETLAVWRYRGTGPPSLKLGRHVRYQPGAVNAWLDACQRYHPANRVKAS